MELTALRASLRGVSAYFDLKQQPVLLHMTAMLDALATRQGEQALESYTAVFHTLREAGFLGLGDWFWAQLRYTETPYALLAEQGGTDPALENGARRDVDIFVLLSEVDCGQYLDAMKGLLPPEYIPVLADLPRWKAAVPFTFASLTQFYRDHGAGLYARYRAFLWENGRLIPVSDPDCPKPQDMLGYELQRSQVESNTRQLVAGHPANNVLLFGDGGTGKSATVKSMLYLPGMEDLRLIEIQKENLTGLPQLMRSLGQRRQKFILFIDDLAFDQDDKTYSSLKTILEGGLEKRPSNVSIYATSNRRHLVRQNFSDRGSDEVERGETISEKTALAERFGLRIPYLTMNRDSYLALVDYLAGQADIRVETEELHAKAMTWEIRHSGRTPRVARQFIASLGG
ncbi:MAG: ATP-binding protein [Pseudoflavonifractor sp.]|nr:ATP-binding protein [Pseudoflavonifractor sp.]